MTDQHMINQIFTDARTHRKFTDRPVSNDLLKELYELVKFAPTASNLCPMRLTFVNSKEQKQRVIEAAAEGNRAKIDSASVVVIVAHDRNFEHIETLAPQMNADAFREQDAHQLDQMAIQNSWLQAGFLITAARALGLDCGPMIGFNKEAIDNAFYTNSDWRSCFLLNLGYGDSTALNPRGARLSFEQACTIM
jgi:3-hydroxypropanoate dehydrogenase